MGPYLAGVRKVVSATCKSLNESAENMFTIASEYFVEAPKTRAPKRLPLFFTNYYPKNVFLLTTGDILTTFYIVENESNDLFFIAIIFLALSFSALW